MNGIQLRARAALLRGIGAALWPTTLGFRAALADPARAQRRVLERLTRTLAATAYGRHLGVRSEADYLRAVPVVDYEALAPWLDRQRAGEPGVLTCERILFYEKTSGSTGPAKYIPYTASLRRAFTRMFAIWAGDVLAHGPRLSTGKLYMSVSPSFAHEATTPPGVPVGMTDDRDYLGGWLRRAAEPFVVCDPAVASAPDAASFKWRTCELLLGEADLEIISVWSPSFLKVLLDEIAANPERYAPLVAGSRRRALLAGDWKAVWPRLAFISCWAAAAAAPQARALAALFPGVTVQGKGLLATEAPMTVPLFGAPGDLPLVHEVLLELEDDAGRLVPVHAGERGREYGIVVSQGGGLYRYRLGDRVVVGARHLGTPCLDFVGRAGGVSDLVGEKLSERFVAGVLADLEPRAFFRTVVPVRAPEAHYVLVLDQASGDRDALAARFDCRLRDAHHYRHARELGQLGAPRVCVAAEAAHIIMNDYASRGMKLGDIKPRALHTGPVEGALATLVGAGAVERTYLP